MLDESTNQGSPPDPQTPRPRTLKLVIQYDGAGFCGWQHQVGSRTVQGELQAALARVLADPAAAVVGAGRTDSGVHAVGQVAHVRTASRIPPGSLRAGVNSLLGRDLRVVEVSEAAADFHARHRAIAKEYRYQMWCGGPVPPFLARYCHEVRGRLEVAPMMAAARLFLGEHDMSSFRAAPCQARSAMRTIYGTAVAQHGPMVVFSICARGFLQHMVRIMVGTLLLVGRGALGVEDVGRILAARDRKLAPATAPGRGLFLVRVIYPASEVCLDASPEAVLSCLNYSS